MISKLLPNTSIRRSLKKQMIIQFDELQKRQQAGILAFLDITFILPAEIDAQFGYSETHESIELLLFFIWPDKTLEKAFHNRLLLPVVDLDIDQCKRYAL